jgi:hypothetical protein
MSVKLVSLYHLSLRQMISEQLEWYQQEKKKYQEECLTA